MTQQQKNEIFKIFEQYQEVIRPMMSALEVEDGFYPIEILNEIRAIVNHYSKILIIDRKEDYPNASAVIDEEIKKTKAHIKRAILDVFKYSCLSESNNYMRFHEQTKNVDLSEIDNGEFIVKLTQLYKAAKDSLINAKKMEHSIENSSDEELNSIYDAFQDAYIKYSELRKHIDTAMDKVEYVKHKQTSKQRKNDIFGYFGILGCIVSVVALICTLVC